MSTHTRRTYSPQGKYKVTGKTHGAIYTQARHGVVPGRRADGVDQPFPNKPVSHRRPLNPRVQDSLDLYDDEKNTGPLSPQKHHSSQHPRKDSHRLSKGELQMAKAIHAKELMLQEKLWKVEEKIRQKIQSYSAGDDQKSEEERYDGAQAVRGRAQTKTRLSELQRTEPVRSREMMTQERRQEDAKLLRRRQDHKYEDKMKNTQKEESARWKRRETEGEQRNEGKGTHEITVHGQEVSAERNRSRWENVKEHTRRKGGDEKGNGILGDTGVKAKEKEQNTTSMGNKGWTRENKCREKTCKQLYSSDDERDTPQMSEHKTSHRTATENHRGAGRKLSGEPQLSPVSSPSHSSRAEQRELRFADSTYDSLQLLPCRICNRKFASERLEMHIQICKKVEQSNRQVFNSYINRTKGTAIEDYWKTHSRPKTPEVTKKKNQRQNKANTRNLREGRLPAGTSQPKQSK